MWKRLASVIEAEIARLEKIELLDKEAADHRAFAEDRARLFVGRRSMLDTIASYLQDADRHPLGVWGESGSGKSALMAKAIADCESRIVDCEIVFRFIGATPASSDGRSLLESLCRQITRTYGGDEETIPTDYKELVKEFGERLNVATRQKPLIVFLDALDQLSDADHARSLIWLSAELPEHVRPVVSTLPGECKTAIERKLPSASLKKLAPMPKEEADDLLKAWLSEAGRTLQPDQRREVLSKFALSAIAEGETSGAKKEHGMPLYLKLAFEEARRWKSYTQIVPLTPTNPGRKARRLHVQSDLCACAMTYEQDSKSENAPCIAFASFSPDAKILITASLEGVLAEWDASTGQRVRVLLDPDGIDDAPAPSVFSIVDGQEVEAEFRLERLSECMRGSSLLSVCFSPDGQYFAVGAANGAVVVWNTESRGELLYWLAHQSPAHPSEVVALDISPDGQWLAAGSSEQGGTSLRVWKLWEARPAIGNEAFSDGGHVCGVSSVCFSPDSCFLVAGGFTLSGYTGPLIYSLETKQRVGSLLYDMTHALQYSPDGKLIATGDDFGTVSTWDVETRTRIHKMRAHRRFVTSVHFSPDGRRLASGSRDGGVKIWDVGTGDQLEEYSFEGIILAFRFSVDGRVLYVAEAAKGSDHPNIHRLA